MHIFFAKKFPLQCTQGVLGFLGTQPGKGTRGMPSRPASVNCQRGAWRNSTLCFPKLIVRLRPDVRYTDRTGACVVGPSAFAAAAPFEPITSPHWVANASIACSTLGAHLPKRPVTGRRYTLRPSRMSSPRSVKRDRAWSTPARLSRRS